MKKESNIKRKNFVLITSLLMLLTTSCAIQEKPIFLKVDTIKVASIALDTIRLNANAFFKNPNDISGKISTDAIKVFVNDTEIATVSSEEFKVPAKKEFSIPLNVKIPTKRIFEELHKFKNQQENKQEHNNNQINAILGGLLNSFINKNVKVQFKGDLRYKVFGFSRKYAIDKTESIQLNF
ncbi:LEA type 2 family protein [Tenacibaculum piscium]|uniref:Uncharacterized protein n=1 Tax=Tenacibaculum piscium TaxID=1458515 RepID=A0A2H1YJH8_9FLAO|nr:LEA type 2 family protein [Tenacibaculum piscium]SOS75662.1 conserved exported hypothetical protein [Tenacibaculum piscium]